MNHNVTLSVVCATTEGWDQVIQKFTQLCCELGEHFPQVSVTSVDLDAVDNGDATEYETIEVRSKVSVALREQGLSDEQITRAVAAMQQQGVLFRERV